MPRPPARALAALAAVLVLGACAGDSGDSSDSGGPDPGERDGASGTPSGTAEPGDDESPAGGGGSVPEPARALLDWQPTGGSPEDRRIVGPGWTALVDGRGSQATLTRPGDEVTVRAGRDRIVTEVMMDERWAVVVAQDEQETRPSVATVVDLDDGRTHEVGDPEPASGGSWAMRDGTLHYGTFGPGRSYCLAEVDVPSGSGEPGWCGEQRQGFTRVTAGDHGTALITFDDARPVACRTPQLVVDGEPEPVTEAGDCSAWDVAATDGGAAWSEVENERRAEAGTFHAVADGATYDLGPGTTGTLTPCGASVYFVRDPQGRQDPARLLRWTPEETLEVVFESESTGNAFLAAPECAGGVLTVSAYGTQGDEQVTAPAP